MTPQERRRELSIFLKQHRDRIAPETVGLPKGIRRRTPGLRREEVAQLAGVGVTWYTWLEQGRDIQVSDRVIHSIARALQMSSAERSYLLELAGQGRSLQPIQSTPQISPALQYILDNQHPCPAYIMNWRWDVLAWNSLARSVLVNFEQLPASERNILWLMFVNEEFRSRQMDWNQVSKNTLAHFRESCTPHMQGNIEFTELIKRLMAVSPEFREQWSQLEVLEKQNAMKELHHPTLGHLTFEMTVLQCGDLPGTKLVIFVPNSDTLAQLNLKT